MNLQLHHLVWLLLIAALASYWWYTRAIREIAYRAVKRYCEKMDIQLLDFAVYESKTRLTRHEGRLTTHRTFQFEFATTGEHRYRGSVEIVARKVLGIDVEPHIYDG